MKVQRVKGSPYKLTAILYYCNRKKLKPEIVTIGAQFYKPQITKPSIFDEPLVIIWVLIISCCKG